MGADGWIDIYDQEKFWKIVKEKGFDLSWCNIYDREIFGRKVTTVYGDTEGKGDIPFTFEEMEEAYIDTWEVWT